MDKNPVKIAVASSDGIVVNSHFGHASKFYIYEMGEKEHPLIEIRKVIPVCKGGNHDDEKLKENMERLGDCQYMLVSRIGYGAAAIAQEKGIEPFEIPGIISESIEQLTNFIKIKNLFH